MLFLVPLSIFGQLDSLQELIYPKDDPNVYFNIIDTNYSMYKLPSGSFKKPVKWKEKHNQRNESSKGYSVGYFSRFYPDSMDLNDALSIIDSAQEFYLIRDAISWCIYNSEEAFPYLIARLSDKRKIGLTNSADLIIVDRIATGDLKFYGHGGFMREDLFTVAGRVSAALNEITGEEFAVVHANLSEKQAMEFKQLWVEYLSKLVE